MSWGPNLLIKQGAKLVQDWNDVVVEPRPGVTAPPGDQGRQALNLPEDSRSSAATVDLPLGPNR